MKLLLNTPSVLPGFRLSLGISVFALSLLVVLPFAMLVWSIGGLGWDGFWRTVSNERVLAALRLTLLTSFWAAAANVVFGTLTAWVLVRYRFPGKAWVNALVDLPFALPTAVTGIALATIYAPSGWIGSWFAAEGWIGRWLPWEVKIAFTPLGIGIALVVVSLPFVVRAVQPVLEELPREYEEAAAVLGASRATVWRRVLLPEMLPALVTGGGMAFARATGEYGSVIFIAGNIPLKTEILPLIIAAKMEVFDTGGAAAVAVFMLLVSFVILLALNAWQWHLSRRLGR